MDEVLLTNIFFLITSMAVVVFTLLVCVALYHLIKILAIVRTITERIEKGSESLAESLTDLQSSVKKGGKFIPQIISALVGSHVHTRRRTKKKKDEADSDEA